MRRDEFPIVEKYADTKVVEVLQEIRQEIEQIELFGQIDEHTQFVRTNEQVKDMTLKIIDKHIKQIEGSDTE